MPAPATSRRIPVAAIVTSAIAVICGIGLFIFLSVYPARPKVQDQPATGQPAPQALIDAANNLKAELDATEKRLDSIQKLLAVLVTAGGVFGFAAGIFSYFNFKELKDSAQSQMAKLEKDFPAIARLNDRIARVSQDIHDDGIVMFDGWDKESYRRLPEQNRQNILLNEVVFSALELFELAKSPDLARHATGIRIAFGRFHGSHYFVDRDEPALERAKIYFRRAIQSQDSMMQERALADLGVVCCWQADNLKSDAQKHELLADAIREARRSFDLACTVRSYNPRALIGRAWLKRREGKLDRAIEDLDDLIEAYDQKKLSSEEKRRYVPTAYLNRACYRVIEAKDSHDQAAVYRKALDDLWKYKAIAIEVDIFPDFRRSLERELMDGGDLRVLAQAHQPELENLRDAAKVQR